MDQVLELLTSNDSFVISTHQRPDGDAIGSQIGLARFLELVGKEVTCINSDDPPANMMWLPGIEEVERFTGSIKQRELIDKADVRIVVDTNAKERLGNVAEAFHGSAGPTILIDHHTHPEEWFDAQFVRDTASSTGELIFELIDAHDGALVDERIATALYTAIMTDTGSFRFNSVTPHVHRITADLLERGGIEPAPIHTKVFDTRSVASLRLLGMVLNTLVLRYDGEIAYLTLDNDMLNDADAGPDDTHGLVNYALTIEGVRAGLLFKETAKGTKISFRSQGDMYVNEWARAFNGGGHRNASGAFVQKPLEETVQAVMDAAPRYLDVTETTRELSDAEAEKLAQMMKEGGRRW